MARSVEPETLKSEGHGFESQAERRIPALQWVGQEGSCGSFQRYDSESLCQLPQPSTLQKFWIQTSIIPSQHGSAGWSCKLKAYGGNKTGKGQSWLICVFPQLHVQLIQYP